MIKTVLRYLLALLMVAAGIAHFASPEKFTRIVPNYLPWPAALVFVSGIFEVLGGAGLLIPKLQKKAAWGLVALYIAVLPANVHMAINEIPFGDAPTPPIFLWLRLPIQLVLIYWAWSYTKEAKPLNSSLL